MDEAQLIELRKIKVAEMQSMTAEGKNEKRKLSTTETRAFAGLKTDIEAIDAQLDLKNKTTKLTNERKMEKSKFSLISAIRNRANGQPLTTEQLVTVEAGREEMRNSGLAYSGDIQIPLESRAVIMATSTGAGQEAIAEDKYSIVEPLRAALVCVQAGATFMTGLKGDVSIPVYSGSSSNWKGEGVTATDGAGTTSEVTLSPKRLTTFIDVSKQFLTQDSTGAEALLMSDIVNSISAKLEGTIFGNAAGSATQPAGFFATAPTVNIGSVTFAKMVALETAVDTANALTTAKYITNSKGRGLLKSTPKATNTATYLLEKGQMNDYPVLVTNNVATGLQVGVNEEGVVFGNWAEFLIGQWGAIDLTVDNLTQAALGNVRIIVNAYFDAKPRRAEAFKTGSIKA